MKERFPAENREIMIKLINSSGDNVVNMTNGGLKTLAIQRRDEARKLLNENFKTMEHDLQQQEEELVRVISASKDMLANKVKGIEDIQQQEAELTEAISRNGELDAQISASRAELETLTQTKETLSSDKMTLINAMSDEQKLFILTKAHADNNAEVIELLHSTGFDEHTYQEQRAMGESDETSDVFS